MPEPQPIAMSRCSQDDHPVRRRGHRDLAPPRRRPGDLQHLGSVIDRRVVIALTRRIILVLAIVVMLMIMRVVPPVVGVMMSMA